MKSKAIFMALLALTFGVQAEPVSQSDAASVARAWAQRNVRYHGRAKGRPIRVRKAMTHRTSDGTEFHSFRMQGGGTVITSADTENAPVIAFTPKDLDLSSVDPKSPLWALLNRDLSQRGKGRLLQNGAAERHRGRWSELRRQGKAVQAMSALSIANEEEEVEGEGGFEPADIRVPALVKSKWNQSTNNNGVAVWNYYTPNCGDPKKFVPGAPTNVVCGCVATAMSQLMRYHEWPHSTTQITRQCSWAGDQSTKMKLRTQAGDFDWANMPFVPDDEITEEQCQAIGKLTSDAGISVYMMYNDINAKGQPGGESGAFSFDIPDSLKSVWGYGSAVLFAAGDKISEATAQSRAKAMKGVLFSNFDAGLPVLMGISGGGGHQIVADGYGFEDEVDYVHLNMGWSGQSDMWYNLPDMEDAGFTVVNDVVYNVMTNGTDSTAIISGRVTDETGTAVENAVVTVLSGTNVVANALTSETGVWGVPVQIVGNQADFSIRVDSPDGLRYGTIDKSAVKKPVTTQVNVSGVAYKPGTTTGEKITVRRTTVPEVKDVDKVGNSWGNDIVLMPPSAKIVTEGGAVTNIFYTLDDALAAAAASDDPVTVEVIAPIKLLKDAAVGGACTIRSSASDPSNVVTVAKGAALAVAAGGMLALEGVTLTNALGVADAELVTVAADGTLELGEGVVTHGRITTETADGLVLTGELKSPVFLDCKASPEICQAFGKVESGAGDAVRASATNIVNWAEESGEIVGVADERDTLRWGERPLAFEEAVGYYVTDDGATTNLSRRLDRLIARYAFADVEAPIVLLADDTLSLALEVKHDLKLFAPEGTNIAITVAPTACFKVSDGVSMSVVGISFTGNGKQGNGLFLVDGGELTLGEGTRLSGLIGTSSDLGNPNSGAVNVMSGTVTLKDGAEIVGCEVTSHYNRSQPGYGGGVYLNGEGCRLVLAGGRIVGCRAQTYGGGVYARKGSTVSLSGETTVIGNFSGNDTVSERRADDIYMAYAELGDFTLDGAAVGRIGVRWGESSSNRNVAGTEFITVTDGVDPESSLPMFISDVNPGLVAGEGNGTLKWEAGPSDAKFLLTVVANDLMKFAGEKDPELTYVAYGQKNPSAVLSGALERTKGEDVGTYAISQGTLDVVGTDYRLEFVGGTFTIVESPQPERKYWVATNDPSMTPLAFSDIKRIAENEWQLSLTNLLRDAEYALSFTDDLTTPFTMGAWFRAEATGPWTTNWVFTAEDPKPAYFWRAHGRTTYVTNWIPLEVAVPNP